MSAESEQILPELPGYDIEREIGRGAMARVYLARQSNLGRAVALKVMTANDQDETLCLRFLKEGRIMARFSHPNIITVYDSGQQDEQYFLAMEYVPHGANLKDRIRNGISAGQALLMTRAIADALGYAHQQGIIHRDVKPANILLREDNTPLLADFGIAKAFENDDAMVTRTGWTVGTPSYMSPEQALGDTLDGRSDVYSLGIVFYEMLTGIKPFTKPSEHLQQPIPTLPSSMATFQPMLNRMLAKQAEERYPNTKSLIEDLEEVYHDIVEAETADITVVQPVKRRQRKGNAKSAIMPTLTARVMSSSTESEHSAQHRRPIWRRRLLQGTAVLALMATTTIIAWQVLQPPMPARTPTPQAAVSSQPVPSATPLRVTPLSAEQQQRVQRLLDNARLAMEFGYLAAPPGSNALEGFAEVLRLDPNNEAALLGIGEISAISLKLARDSLERGLALSDTLRYIEAGLEASQHNPVNKDALLELRNLALSGGDQGT